uniref:Uncharacterized protein n=1 Tax=Medicago truncatula TaxID=3880 RepID=Q2HSL6_MEDTR|nr:hypothetical protein MtrDRAFT_AC151521g49v2 [Medicago truncatula]
MAMCYGTLGCVTLRFCHLFHEIFRGQQMKRRSLHNSGSGMRREARLTPMTWSEAEEEAPAALAGPEPGPVQEMKLLPLSWLQDASTIYCRGKLQ